MRLPYKIGLVVFWQIILVIIILQFLENYDYVSGTDTDFPQDPPSQQSLEPILEQEQQSENFSDIQLNEEEKIPLIFVYYIVIFAISSNVFLIVLMTKIIQREAKQKIKYEKFSTIGEVTSKIVHNIRNPLSVIQLGISLIKEENKSPELNDRYETILNSVNRLKQQINDILDHIRSNGYELENSSFKEIIENSLSDIVVPKNITITKPEIDKTIYCDKFKIQTVITNIIYNAIQAMEETEGKIIIRLTEDSKYIVCSIEDTGPGISKENISKIFEPLFTTKQMGTGLGLGTCQKIIEDHHGKISVKTNPTVFEIKLLKK